MLGTNGASKIIPSLVIPPNEITKHTSFLKIPEDISILTINPHMHLLGKSFKAYALTPQQDTIRLISIPRWDFRWQYFYTFPTMLKIPAGSVIFVEAEYDNTAKNPNNPNNPPQEVRERLDNGGAGMRTTDEMLQFIITWLPYQAGDENVSLEVEQVDLKAKRSKCSIEIKLGLGTKNGQAKARQRRIVKCGVKSKTPFLWKFMFNGLQPIERQIKVDWLQPKLSTFPT